MASSEIFRALISTGRRCRRSASRSPQVIAGLFAYATAVASGQLAMDSLPLNLDPASAHELVVSTPAPGLVELRTTGHDPFVSTASFAVPRADQTVLSFEYIAMASVPGLQVFVGAPWTETYSRSAELPHSEGWATFSLDLKPAWRTAPAVPNRLRIDLGGEPGRIVQIRNLHLRLPDGRERDAGERLEARRAADRQLDTELRSYLARVFPARITRVAVGLEQIEITGQVPRAAGTLFLAEVQISDDVVHPARLPRVAAIPDTADGIFSVRLPRHVAERGTRRDRLLSRWRVVRATPDADEALSAVHYADEVTARYPWPELRPRTKKGLAGFNGLNPKAVADLDALGIDSVTVNLLLSRYLRAKPSAGTFPVDFQGCTLHIDRREIEKLDATMRAAAKRGALVLGIILVGKAGAWDGELGGTMQHPDCDPAGVYSMANVTSPEGVRFYAALLDFLADRYSRPDAPFGRIHHWIVHNEVDAGWVWTNCGEKPPMLFMDQYHKSMRIVHLIARQYDPHARAYISLEHQWTWIADHRFTPAREVLENLLAFSHVEGDFEWGIAYHPYPESLHEPKTWLDRKVDFTYDTPMITFKNLEVLDAWVREPTQRFRGERIRSVYLTEQGPNSPDYSERALQEQAAALAYVWQKLRRLPAIEGFQFHNWADNRAEGGLRIGLRRFADDAESPLGPKPVWNVYRVLDTPNEEAGIAFALPIVGVKSWDEVPYSGPIRRQH